MAAALGRRYAVERELGRGGMGTVYLAWDRKHARRVAIKILPPDLASALGPERFLREIAIAARLSHPHILPLHDSGQAGGVLYYVMPWVEGESLRQRLALNPGHDVIQHSAGLTGVVEGQDVGMAEAGRDGDLAQKALRAECGGEVGGQDFDSYAARVLAIPG